LTHHTARPQHRSGLFTAAKATTAAGSTDQTSISHRSAAAQGARQAPAQTPTEAEAQAATQAEASRANDCPAPALLSGGRPQRARGLTPTAQLYSPGRSCLVTVTRPKR
jgi:hypothetical protein